MKLVNRLILGSLSLFLVPVHFASLAYGVDLSFAPILPPSQVFIIGQGMGNAIGADGTLFNATSVNPALLSKAPHTVEFLNLGLNISDDVIGMADYAQNGLQNDIQNDNIKPDQFFRDIVSNDAVSISNALIPFDSIMGHVTNKAVQAGLGLNISAKIGDHFGFQVYN